MRKYAQLILSIVHAPTDNPCRPLLDRQTNTLTLSVISCPCCTLGGSTVVNTLLTYLMVELLSLSYHFPYA